MSLLKNHLTPILHNAIGQLIAILVVAVITSGALLTLVRPLNVSAFSTIQVPLWCVVLIVITAILLLVRDRIRGRVKIRSASYGAGFAQADVTDRVKTYVRHGVLNVLATTEKLCDGNDPFHGATKALKVDYTLNGRDRTVEVIEGYRLILP